MNAKSAKNERSEVSCLEDKRLTPRKQQILKAIVDAHIHHGEPVGSKYLAADMQISASPATIRNEMADLEEMGFLMQPHASAGRVPSDKAYRLYVNSMMDEVEISNEDKMIIQARDSAKQIESELEYPGQIKVNVIRETKAVEYAK